MIIAALATALAGTDEPAAVARQINGVTRDGEPCGDFAACLELVNAGTDIDYDGASGPQDFSRPGEPSVASYTVEEFNELNRIESTSITYRMTRFL